MSKKMRQTVTMLVLCVLLIGAGVGYYALIKYQTLKEGEAEEEEGISLYEMDDSQIVSLSYKNEKAEMDLIKEDDVWKMKDDLDFPLDQDRITAMIDEVASVTADLLVTDQCDDLEQYQLQEPELTVEVEDSEGNSQTLAIGMESISGGGRYAYCGDSSTVYILSTSIYSSFDYTTGQIMETAEFPAITADYVTRLKINAKKGRDFEVVYDEKNSPYKDIFSWAIYSPYSNPVAADVDQLQTLFEGYAGLDFSEGVTYQADDEALKEYGLKKPSYSITLDYYKVKGSSSDDTGDGTEEDSDNTDSAEQKKVDKTLQLFIGKMNQDKTGYYAQIAGDGGVYLLAAATAESLVDVAPIDYVYQRLYAGSLAELESMDMEYQGKEYQFTLSPEDAEKDSSGADAADNDSDTDTESSEEEYTVKVNGKKADADAFESAYNIASNLAPNGEIDSKVKPESDQTVAEITFHEKAKDVIMEIYPYDGKNFYRVKVDDVMEFVVDIRNVDNMLEGFAACMD